MLKDFSVITIILLLIWISFFPSPVQQNYRLVIKLFLALGFIIVLIKKRASIFKLDDFPLWIFLVAIGINVLFAQEKDIAFRTYLDLALPMFLIYYLVSDGFSSEVKFNLLAKVICVLSILVALGGIFEAVFAFNLLYEHFMDNPYYPRYITGFVRPMSTQYNPAVLGSYLLGCLPFGFFLFKREKNFFKFLGAAGIVLNIVVIILTFSRGVFLGLIAMIIFYLFTQRKYYLITRFFIILLTFILVCSYLPYPFNRFGIDMFTLENRGIMSAYRFDRCIMAKNMLKDYFLTGLGFQHFRIRFYEYYSGRYPVSYEFMIADNMYLTILAETGILGFLAFFVFILALFKKWLAQFKMSKYASHRKLQLLMVFSAFFGLLVNMGSYELFYWPNPYLYFCILAGCIGAICRNRKEKPINI